MPYKDPKAQAEYHRKYQETHKEKILDQHRRYYKRHKAEIQERARGFYKKNRDRICARERESGRVYRARIKAEVIGKYGGRCACCGEAELEFLSIDHIDGNGVKHRKEILRGKGNGRNQCGHNMYQWLRANGFPVGFQVLCFNCNFSKHLGGGLCVHQRRGSSERRDLGLEPGHRPDHQPVQPHPPLREPGRPDGPGDPGLPEHRAPAGGLLP